MGELQQYTIMLNNEDEWTPLKTNKHWTHCVITVDPLNDVEMMDLLQYPYDRCHQETVLPWDHIAIMTGASMELCYHEAETVIMTGASITLCYQGAILPP
jgi:hypothetical protein